VDFSPIGQNQWTLNEAISPKWPHDSYLERKSSDIYSTKYAFNLIRAANMLLAGIHIYDIDYVFGTAIFFNTSQYVYFPHDID